MRRPVYRSTFKPRSIRRSESKAQRKLIFNLILVVVLVFVFFNWGLPFIIGSLSFLNKNKPSQTLTETKIDEAIAPPVLFIPFESTNSAKLPISGYSTPLAKVELFVDDELKSSIQTDSEGKFTIEAVNLSLGTNNIYAVTVNEAEKKSLPSKTIKLYYSNEKPLLEVTQPADGAEIKGGDEQSSSSNEQSSSSNKKITVAGKTDPNNSVTINGSTVIVNSEGNFQTSIGINDGDNIITIVSSNSFGNINQIQKTVKYVPQEPSPSPAPSASSSP
jgi:hypothetical protein